MDPDAAHIGCMDKRQRYMLIGFAVSLLIVLPVVSLLFAAIVGGGR